MYNPHPLLCDKSHQKFTPLDTWRSHCKPAPISCRYRNPLCCFQHQDRALPKLFPPQPCKIRLARFLASSGKLGLSNRFGYVHRATTCSAKNMSIGHFAVVILSWWYYVNFPWKWRSQILANLKHTLLMKSLQLVFLSVVLTEEKKIYQVPS